MGNPKVAFGVHVKELDMDSRISVDEAVSIAQKAGYEELVIIAHTYHPTDLAPLNIDALAGIFKQTYPIKVTFAPEVNIRPTYERRFPFLKGRKLNGVLLDLKQEYPAPLRGAVLSLHFTAAIFLSKSRDSETCPEQSVETMFEMYRWALDEWESKYAEHLKCPAIIGHPFRYGHAKDVGVEVLASLDLRFELERREHWAEIVIRTWRGVSESYRSVPVVLSFDAHNREQLSPRKHEVVLAEFRLGEVEKIFGE